MVDELMLHRQFLTPAQADDLFAHCRHRLAWEQHELQLFGRRVLTPRLVAYLGDAGADYTYSGQRLQPAPWTAPLAELRDRLAELAGVQLTSALLNWYRDGADSMGWHSDDEPELGPDPVIVSLSLGAARRCVFRPRRDSGLERGERREFALGHGDLLVMGRGVQRRWQHCVPKTARPVGERINATFRATRRDRSPA